MAEWITIDPATFKKTPASELDKPNVAGARLVRVYVSPYDIPEAVRAFLKDGKLIVEFRYLGNEKLEESDEMDGVCMHVGKKSGRVYAVHVDLSKIKEKGVTVMMVSVFDQLKHSSNARGSASFDVVQQILQSRGTDIFAGMPLA